MNIHQRRLEDASTVEVRGWSDDDTNALADLIANGATFAQAAKILGRSKNSAIGRFHRVVSKMGRQAA